MYLPPPRSHWGSQDFTFLLLNFYFYFCYFCFSLRRFCVLLFLLPSLPRRCRQPPTALAYSRNRSSCHVPFCPAPLPSLRPSRKITRRLFSFSFGSYISFISIVSSVYTDQTNRLTVAMRPSRPSICRNSRE